MQKNQNKPAEDTVSWQGKVRKANKSGTGWITFPAKLSKQVQLEIFSSYRLKITDLSDNLIVNPSLELRKMKYQLGFYLSADCAKQYKLLERVVQVYLDTQSKHISKNRKLSTRELRDNYDITQSDGTISWNVYVRKSNKWGTGKFSVPVQVIKLADLKANHWYTITITSSTGEELATLSRPLRKLKTQSEFAIPASTAKRYDLLDKNARISIDLKSEYSDQQKISFSSSDKELQKTTSKTISKIKWHATVTSRNKNGTGWVTLPYDLVKGSNLALKNWYMIEIRDTSGSILLKLDRPYGRKSNQWGFSIPKKEVQKLELMGMKVRVSVDLTSKHKKYKKTSHNIYWNGKVMRRNNYDVGWITLPAKIVKEYGLKIGDDHHLDIRDTSGEILISLDLSLRKLSHHRGFNLPAEIVSQFELMGNKTNFSIKTPRVSKINNLNYTDIYNTQLKAIAPIQQTIPQEWFNEDHVILKFDDLYPKRLVDTREIEFLKEVMAGDTGDANKILFENDAMVDVSDPRSFINPDLIKFYCKDFIDILQSFDIIQKKDKDENSENWTFGSGVSVYSYTTKLAGANKLAVFLDFQAVKAFQQRFLGYKKYFVPKAIPEQMEILKKIEDELGEVLQRTRTIKNESFVSKSEPKSTRSINQSAKIYQEFRISHVSNYFEMRAALDDIDATKEKLHLLLKKSKLHNDEKENIVDKAITLSFGHEANGYDYMMSISIAESDLQYFSDIRFTADMMKCQPVRINNKIHRVFVKPGEVKAFNGRTRSPTDFITTDKRNVRAHVNLPIMVNDRLIKYKKDRYAVLRLAKTLGANVNEKYAIFSELLRQIETPILRSAKYNAIVNYKTLYRIQRKRAGEFGFLIKVADDIAFFTLDFPEMKHINGLMKDCSSREEFVHLIISYFEGLRDKHKSLWKDRAAKFGFDRDIAGVVKALNNIVGMTPGGYFVKKNGRIALERSIDEYLVIIKKAPKRKKSINEEISLDFVVGIDEEKNRIFRFRASIDHNQLIDPNAKDSAYVSPLSQLWDNSNLIQNPMGNNQKSNTWRIPVIDKKTSSREYLIIQSAYLISRRAAYQRFENLIFGGSLTMQTSFTYIHRGNFMVDNLLGRLDELGAMGISRSAFFGIYHGRSASKNRGRMELDGVPNIVDVMRKFLLEGGYEFYDKETDSLRMTSQDERGETSQIQSSLTLQDFFNAYFQGYKNRKLNVSAPFFILLDLMENISTGKESEKKSHTGIWADISGSIVHKFLIPKLSKISLKTVDDAIEVANEELKASIDHTYKRKEGVISGSRYRSLDLISNFFEKIGHSNQLANKIVTKELVQVQIPLIIQYQFKIRKNQNSNKYEINSIDDISFTGVPQLIDITRNFIQQNHSDMFDSKSDSIVASVKYSETRQKIVSITLKKFFDLYFQFAVQRSSNVKKPFFNLLDIIESNSRKNEKKKMMHYGIWANQKGKLVHRKVISQIKKAKKLSFKQALKLAKEELFESIHKIYSLSEFNPLTPPRTTVEVLIEFVIDQGFSPLEASEIVVKEMVENQLVQLVIRQLNKNKCDFRK